MRALPKKPDAQTRAACKALGANLRAARGAIGMTQEAAAAGLGIDPSYYGKIERGEVNVTIGMLVALYRLFDWELPAALRRP